MWYKHNKEGIEHDKGMIRRLSNEDSNEISTKLTLNSILKLLMMEYMEYEFPFGIEYYVIFTFFKFH